MPEPDEQAERDEGRTGTTENPRILVERRVTGRLRFIAHTTEEHGGVGRIRTPLLVRRGSGVRVRLFGKRHPHVTLRGTLSISPDVRGVVVLVVDDQSIATVDNIRCPHRRLVSVDLDPDSEPKFRLVTRTAAVSRAAITVDKTAAALIAVMVDVHADAGASRTGVHANRDTCPGVAGARPPI